MFDNISLKVLMFSEISKWKTNMSIRWITSSDDNYMVRGRFPYDDGECMVSNICKRQFGNIYPNFNSAYPLTYHFHFWDRPKVRVI